MKYKIERKTEYDFLKESYATMYPNLHRYPATMIPQIGVKLLREFNITSGNMLDPYCGSGSSFAAGIDVGIKNMYGFDINPLAVIITKAKFIKISPELLKTQADQIKTETYKLIKDSKTVNNLPYPNITNVNFWFSEEVLKDLNVLRNLIYQRENKNVQNFFLVPFSDTIRESSYTRNGEFKLFRMKKERMEKHKPDVFKLFFTKLNNAIDIYENYYYPKLTGVNVKVEYSHFNPIHEYYDTVLTSPPYGDSRTTVAYGQFSTLSNEWMGIEYARQIDKLLMGGKRVDKLYDHGLLAEYIQKIHDVDPKRSLEVSSFYYDLEESIIKVANSVKPGGIIFYILGNRTVKRVQLPSDQFIAEKFEEHGFKHIITYERALSSKAMPIKNSPTNVKGDTINTMLFEYIVICKKCE